MAKKFEFEKCSLAGEISTSMMNDLTFMFPAYLAAPVYRCIFRASAMMVKYNSTKDDHRVGFSFNDSNGEFVYGAILTFNPPEEDSEDGGNWTLDMTFNKDDMKDVDKSLDNFSAVFMTIMQTELYSSIHAMISSNEDVALVIALMMRAIFNFLDTNSNDSEETVELEMPDVFLASVSFDSNGSKVYSLVPGSTVKQIVKNDDTAEKIDKAINEASAAKAAMTSFIENYNRILSETGLKTPIYVM